MKKPAPKSERVVRCPGCGGKSVYSDANPYRPFCSARCKNQDLGAWAAEGYRIDATPERGRDPHQG